MSDASAKVRVREIADEVVAPVAALRALSAAQPAVPEPEIISPRRAALLGEDNPVNSRVAARILEKLGFAVDLVASGWEAVQAAANKEYSVIVLDCDTPAIGGYHTVMAIREGEKGANTPVIALTSHTMQWDRREREAAGIDGYIAKPIEVEAMTAVLARVVDDQAPPSGLQLLALDRNVLSKLRSLSGGDLVELRALTGLFVETASGMLERMRKAIEENEPGTVALTAHSLRGSSGQLGARRMEEICSTIEALARAGAPADRLADLIDELGAAFERVQADLSSNDLEKLASGPTTAPAAAPTEPPASSGEADEVLIAEDDPLIARFLSSSLTGAGLRVTRVNNGEAALQAMQERQFACVVLDINMPKLDGYGVLSEMRVRPVTKKTPVLILSLRSQEHDIVRAFDLGVDDYVTKPFSPLEVIARVKRLMRR